MPTNVGLFTDLPDLYKSSSSCIGFCISLGEEFFQNGLSELDGLIIPLFKEHIGPRVSPRVVPAYAILYWFASKVENLICNEQMCVLLYF